MVILQFLLLLVFILIGARLSGIGMGLMGGLGTAVMVIGFGLKPATPPIDVMLMIFSVVSAAAAMQAAGGMDYLVQLAEKILRKHPEKISFLGPLVTYIFTFLAGTAHINYSILPVIAEVATKKRIRPERALGMAVISAHLAITASPIAAATVALLALLSPMGLDLSDVLKVAVPATLIGTLVGSWVSSKLGNNLHEDPIFLEKCKDPVFAAELKALEENEGKVQELKKGAKTAVAIFGIAVLSVVIFGSFPEIRPSFMLGEELRKVSMAEIIEMLMLSAAALMVLSTKTSSAEVANASLFKAGSNAVLSIFGVVWMSDTIIQGNFGFIQALLGTLVQSYPWTFAFALFILSMLLFSQAATVRALMPLGISLGIPMPYLLAMFPAVNGDFFIPSYPTLLATISFDRTGSTSIGKYLFNHSFMIPGLVGVGVSVLAGFLLVSLMY